MNKTLVVGVVVVSAFLLLVLAAVPLLADMSRDNVILAAPQRGQNILNQDNNGCGGEAMGCSSQGSLPTQTSQIRAG